MLFCSVYQAVWHYKTDVKISGTENTPANYWI
jgi:hypothetical protein